MKTNILKNKTIINNRMAIPKERISIFGKLLSIIDGSITRK